MNEAPTYHAISYTWGDKTPVETIMLDGEPKTVRKNCADVLRQILYFRSSDSGYYWIDALCIDQTSVNEKNCQVARMGKIFRNAEHVLVCLGDHHDDAEYAFKVIREFGEYHSLEPTKFPKNQFQTLPLVWFASQPNIDPKRLASSLASLCQRPYFERVWVVHELLLAQTASMCCKDLRLPIQCPYTNSILEATLCYAAMALDTQGALSLQGLPKQESNYTQENRTLTPLCNRLLGLLSRRWRCWERDCRMGFSEALELFLPLRCQDGRDYVYGALNLIDWKCGAPIHPDYGKTYLELTAECLWEIWYSTSSERKDRVGTYTSLSRRLLEAMSHSQ